MKYVPLIFVLLCTSCGFIEKNASEKELSVLAHEVLKRNKGVIIEIKPVDLEKK
jgi:hypothetical protein